MRRNYNLTFDPAIPGLLSGVFAGAPRVRAYRLNAGGTLEQWKVTIPGAPDTSIEYKLLADTAVASFKTDADATQAELLNGLYNAILTNPIIGSHLTPSKVGNDIFLTSKKLGYSHSVSTNSLDTVNDLVIAKTASVVLPEDVPFGRFVGRAASDSSQVARLISLPTDIVLGVSVGVKDIERDAIGQFAKTAYRAEDMMDICDRTEGCDGIWVETVDEPLSVNDIPYISLAAGQEGKVTKVTTGNISIAAQASFQSDQKTLSSGKKIILVSYNKV